MWIKILGSDGKSPTYRYAWDLPRLDGGTWRAGAWSKPVEGRLQACAQGYNVAPLFLGNSGGFFLWYAMYLRDLTPSNRVPLQIYEAAIINDAENFYADPAAHKGVARTMALTRPLRWDVTRAMLFTADALCDFLALSRWGYSVAEQVAFLQVAQHLRAWALRPDAIIHAGNSARLQETLHSFPLRPMTKIDLGSHLEILLRALSQGNDGVSLAIAVSKLIERMISTSLGFQDGLSDRLKGYLRDPLTPAAIYLIEDRTRATARRIDYLKQED